MALFKIFKGSGELPKTYKDGYCYFEINSGKMYIDTKDSDSTGRIVLNASHADTATKADTATSATKATQDGNGNVISSTYLKLSGGTLNGALNFSNNNPLTWTQGAYRQRISITDDDVSNTPVFHFQQSADSGNSWTDLMRIFDNGSVYATTFVGALSGNASTATKLATARTIRTNLASTSTASFDGTADITPGVTGVLPVANGGTGVNAHTVNRLIWSINATQIQGGYHYANSSKVGINYTSEPSTNFYVNGTSTLGGATNINGDVTIQTNDTDRFITFPNGEGFCWRIGYLGAGAGEANYLAFQSDGPVPGTYANALRFGLQTLDAAFGGNVYPLANNAKTLGTSAFKWSNVYATTFTGNLSGNATTATTLQTARTLTIGKTGKSFNGSANVSWTLSEIAAGQTISQASFGNLFIERSGSTNGASIGFKNSNGTLGYIGMYGSANSGLHRWSADTSSSYTILDTGNYTTHLDGRYINAAGDTMTGVLTLKGSVYDDAYTGTLNCNNSNIYGVNSIFMCDLSDSPSEGIHFYNTSTAVDTIYAKSGTLYFVPNRALGTNGTSYTILHTGNGVPKTGGTFTGSLFISHATNATMDSTTTNPRIVFSESGTQPVGLVYTDYNSYRSPAGLKVLGLGTDASPAWFEVEGNIYATKVYGAVWNDYAEYRSQNEEIKPGYCVASLKNGKIYKTTKRLQACEGIVSDTFGFAIGETNECKTPLAVAGRVLAYCEEDRDSYEPGDCVCASENGKVSKMTDEEICKYPHRIIGIVSEIPEYKTWGTGNVDVNGRIWIKVK